MYKATEWQQLEVERQKQAALQIKCPTLAHLGFTTEPGCHCVYRTLLTWLIYNLLYTAASTAESGLFRRICAIPACTSKRSPTTIHTVLRTHAFRPRESQIQTHDCGPLNSSDKTVQNWNLHSVSCSIDLHYASWQHCHSVCAELMWPPSQTIHMEGPLHPCYDFNSSLLQKYYLDELE